MNNFVYTKCPERMDPWTRKEIGGCHGLRKWEWGTRMMVIDSLLSGWHMHSGFRKCWLYNFVSVLKYIEIIISSKVIDFIEGKLHLIFLISKYLKIAENIGPNTQ